MRIWSRVADAIARDGTCTVVTIADVRGSAPREAGARMVVHDDGGFHGTIGVERSNGRLSRGPGG